MTLVKKQPLREPWASGGCEQHSDDPRRRWCPRAGPRAEGGQKLRASWAQRPILSVHLQAQRWPRGRGPTGWALQGRWGPIDWVAGHRGFPRETRWQYPCDSCHRGKRPSLQRCCGRHPQALRHSGFILLCLPQISPRHSWSREMQRTVPKSTEVWLCSAPRDGGVSVNISFWLCGCQWDPQVGTDYSADQYVAPSKRSGRCHQTEEGLPVVSTVRKRD